MMLVAFIINSQSRKANAAMHALSMAFAEEHKFLTTTHAGHARELATQCCSAGFTHVIAVGGDGTLNEVVDGMMISSNTALELPILSFIPCGTGNDFARNFGITGSIDAFIHRIKEGQITYSDVGFVAFSASNGMAINRHFINVMDIGLGGNIARKVNTYRRSRWSALAYQRGIMSTLPFYRKSVIEISSPQLNYTGPVLSVVLANGKWFGNGLGIAPSANPSNGQLSLVLLGRVGIMEYILNLPNILRCKPIRHREVKYVDCKEVHLGGEPTAMELDGEFVGYSPCYVQVKALALRLLL
jgi:YegS/Rv2252/BmrU family lipid kinase